jgi:hypothetical protein
MVSDACSPGNADTNSTWAWMCESILLFCCVLPGVYRRSSPLVEVAHLHSRHSITVYAIL